jgi:hypothetical protein
VCSFERLPNGGDALGKASEWLHQGSQQSAPHLLIHMCLSIMHHTISLIRQRQKRCPMAYFALSYGLMNFANKHETGTSQQENHVQRQK